MAVIVWLIVGVAFAIAEIFTTTFIISMLAVGALAAAGTAALGGDPVLQIAAFSVASALSLWLVRPALRRHLNLGGANTPMGIDAIEGSTVYVLEEIDAEHGLVNIEGEMWRARAHDASEVYRVGDQVRVLEIKGATAIVWKD